jgi:hypothetical protein
VPKPQPQAEPTPKADQRGQGPRSAASQTHDKDAGRDGAKREEENRKSKN